MSFLLPDRASVRRRRLLAGGIAVLATVMVMTAFLLDSRSLPGVTVDVIYVQSWGADRSRDDAIADQRATRAAQEARLAQARSYIATLSGKARADAQKQYDAYVAGNAVRRDIPFVTAAQP
jgi:hypothetical protein